MEAKYKYLDLIQANIARMSGASMSYKGWMVVTVSAILGAYATLDKPSVIWVALFPTIIFWFLDAFHLSIEKKFRDIYDDAIKAEIVTFKMEPAPTSFMACIQSMFSKTLLPLYGPVLLITTSFGAYNLCSC